MAYLSSHQTIWKMPKWKMPNVKKVICSACALCLTIHYFSRVLIGSELQSITLAWDWYPGASSYAAGPDGGVVFDIHMCDEFDADCTYDDPVIVAIDDCWWNFDHYSCQAAMEYELEGNVYFFPCRLPG
jgi:hypothetical protein